MTMSKPSPTFRLPCGCHAFKATERLSELCATHNDQWRELHARAIKDYRDGHPLEDIDL